MRSSLITRPLEFNGRAYTAFEQFTYLTKRGRGWQFRFRGATYHAVSHPKALIRRNQEDLYIETQDRAGSSLF